MYCPHYHLEDRLCHGTCATGCPYGFETFTLSTLKYKCGFCNGEFSVPSEKTIGYTWELILVCPFCGQVMKGL